MPSGWGGWWVGGGLSFANNPAGLPKDWFSFWNGSWFIKPKIQQIGPLGHHLVVPETSSKNPQVSSSGWYLDLERSILNGLVLYLEPFNFYSPFICGAILEQKKAPQQILVKLENPWKYNLSPIPIGNWAPATLYMGQMAYWRGCTSEMHPQ